jgi:N-acetylglucosaminyl-diphospho-decaprenol L-rhamnosyltransferase
MSFDGNADAGGPMVEPKLTIVFVNYNTAGLLREALASLAEHPARFGIEVIVVDNASTEDGGLERADFALPFRVIRNRTNRGYGAAANQGIFQARGAYVAVANTDIKFIDHSVEQLVQFLQEEPAAGIVSPLFLWSDLTPQSPARRFPRLRYLFAGRRSVVSTLLPNRRRSQEFTYAGIEQSPGPVEVEAVFGTFMVAPRQLLLDLSGFDERYVFYVEDVDLCRRVHEAGRKVFVFPQARVIHYLGWARHRRGMAAEFWRVRGFCRYFRVNYPKLSGLLFLLFAAYLAMLYSASILGLREPERSLQRTRQAT